MAKISKNADAGLGTTLHPRENQFITATLGSLNAELVAGADGAAAVSLGLSGTYVGTHIVEGTLDGTNWDAIPMRPVNGGGIYVLTIGSGATGRWQGPCGGFRQVRARMSAWTSGAAAAYLVADISPIELLVVSKAADQGVTVTAATGAAATLVLPAAGAGLFHYISRIIVQRHTSALLTAGTTPLLVTTTNLPGGSRTLSFPADAATQGTVATETIEPSAPIRSVAANLQTTVVMPATTGVIWRATADYYNAPYG